MVNLSGSEIRDAREKADMTMEELADKMRVSRMTIYNWEKGNHRPSDRVLEWLKDILGI